MNILQKIVAKVHKKFRKIRVKPGIIPGFFRIKPETIAGLSFIVLTDNPLIRSKKIFSDFIRNSKNCVPKKTKIFWGVSWCQESKILIK